MAAPHIPNLLELRGRGRGSRGRARGRGGAASVPDNDDDENAIIKQARQDAIVQQTDADASLSRASAVVAGYLEDPFALHFAPSSTTGQNDARASIRRMPVINRGTHARTTAIDRLVDAFLASDSATCKQIISLGAGSDTRALRLASRPHPPRVLYHELDFPANARRKRELLQKFAPARKLIVNATLSEDGLHSSWYHLHAVDLRSLQTAVPPGPPILQGVDPAMPTLLISECCLTYLRPAEADAVVHYFAQSALHPTTALGLALYEPINPHDAFGQVMVANLRARGIVLQTLQRYDSLEAQIARLKAMGLRSGQAAADIEFIMEHWLDDDEKQRVSQVEMLDEIEELNMLTRHYCIAWGWRRGDAPEEDPWRAWAELRAQQR